MVQFERPRGTRDFQPAEMARRRTMEARLRGVLESFGYGEVQTPTFEHLQLFTEKSGDAVVEQLYAFQDKSDRDLTLRPELTAPVIRFYLNDLSAEPKPLRLYYFGNCFRYERPQSGRYREFWQFGIELIGAGGAAADAEVIAVADACIRAAEVPDYELKVGHIGLLAQLVDELPLDEHERSSIYPLIDKDAPELLGELRETGADEALCHAIDTLASFQAPVDLTTESEAVAETLEKTLAPAREVVAACGLDERGMGAAEASLASLAETLVTLSDYDVEQATLDLGVARGLDYYTGVVFEFEAPDLGAEKQICGGGSYTLAEVFGGQATDTAGFGLGFDRVLLASQAETGRAGPKVHVVPIGDEAQGPARELAASLRRAGVATTLDLNQRGPSKNLDFANSQDIPKVVLLGSREIEEGTATVKDMATGEQEAVPLDELAARLAEQG